LKDHRIETLINGMIVIDGHFDLLSDVADRRRAGERRVIERIYLPELIKGHIDIVVASVYVDSVFLPEMALRKCMEQISALYEELDESPDAITLCLNSADMKLAKQRGQVGFLLSLEGAEPLGVDTAILRSFYALGVRGIGLVWSRRNHFAEGCSFDGSGRKSGLSESGGLLVREAERLGMFIDVSHLSDEGLADVLKYATKPFVASHSNARTIAPSMRNLTDQHVAEMSKKGCVIGLNAASIIASNSDEGATYETLLAHIDHLVSVAGIEHVAFGFDLCDQFMASYSDDVKKNMPRVPFDIIKGHGQVGDFIMALFDHGYCENNVRKIAGENLLAFFGNVIG
jgi:membrane dipeptidase